MQRNRLTSAAVAGVGLAAIVGSMFTSGAADAAVPREKAVCATPKAGHAACHAEILVNSQGQAVDATGAKPRASTPPSTAMTPSQIQSAYNLDGLSSGGKTVAIVDAYGYPNLESDLATFRSYYGLSDCTVADGCLRIINQTGGTTLPKTDVGWAEEQALDVDAVSAACPDCNIVVVQANSASYANLGTAVDTAAEQSGVVAISNSYGGSDAADSTYGSYYQHPGIAVTASTGDDGYEGGSYPASSSYVTAVGGTSLTASSNDRGWSETVWDGAGSGCSSYNTALSAASSFDTGCSKRAMADVAAAADPEAGGLAVYYPTSASASTWGQIGGTSESAPLIAAVYALGSQSLSGYPNALPYENSDSLYDVTSGSNGSCTTSQWCTARSGWDGPTGVGTPNGADAF
ncbi:MAG: hypothetical protein QM638_15520 [Nocardioides sp.]|uniref:S53 family peptidase n=1 Tax=Nocardioides sp. TaxID=35761 RepID=UPI0039E3829E